VLWLFNVEDTTEVLERCIRLFVQIAKKSVKFLSNLERIVRFIARTVSQSTRIVVVSAE